MPAGSLSVRSFTHGFDLFEPARVVVWHRMHPEPNRKWINDFEDATVSRRHQRAMARLRLLLAGDPDRRLGRYSLGPERSLSDYHRFSGLDCANYTIHPDAERGLPPDPLTISD